LRIAAPREYQPDASLLKRLTNSKITVSDDPQAAAKDADVLYTDVWVSMGFEAESADRLKRLGPFQVNDQLVEKAARNVIVLHCLPAYRGKEITAEVLEKNAQTIFDQAENRLHAQKAILKRIAK
jgi:ornithine carbamoyltransferase